MTITAQPRQQNYSQTKGYFAVVYLRTHDDEKNRSILGDSFDIVECASSETKKKGKKDAYLMTLRKFPLKNLLRK